MNVEFVLAAEFELDEPVAYYAAKSPALAVRFRGAVADGVARIADSPHAWQPVGGGARRYRLRRFPYGLVYRVKDDTATIYAVMHLKRRPQYWRSRIP
jgi:plasmid stabilization system protein ParE